MSVISTLTVKLQAQISEFQSEFKEAARSTEKFQQEFEKTATKASAYGTLIARGLEIGISAAKQLGEAALENASKIDDLSKKTGLSMRTIQEFQHVAGETGATVDQFANAAFRLGTNLSGGSKSVVAGVKELGLSFDDLKAKSPDEQFRTVIRALEDMDSQQDANRLGILLFGRTYKEIAVAVAEGYTDLAAGARKMTDEQIKRLAEAEDAWKRFGRTTVIVSGQAIAEVMAGWSKLQLFLANVTFPGAIAPKPTLTPEQIAFDKSFEELHRRQTLERIEQASRIATADENGATRSRRAVRSVREEVETLIDVLKKTPQLELGLDRLPGFKFEIEPPDLSVYRGGLKDQIELTQANLPGIVVPVTIPDLDTDIKRDFSKLFGELEDIAFRTGHYIASLIGQGIRTGDWSSFEDNLRDALAEGMGKAAASAVDFFVPGLGTLLQPIFSGLSDLLLGAFGLGTTDYERRVRDNAKALQELRDAATDAAGGFANLQLRAELAAPHLVEALRTQDAAYLKIVLAELDTAFGNLQSRIADTWGALAEGARGSGVLLDASLTPFIQQLESAGVITDDLALSLLQMTTDNSAGWREMQGLAEKYGIELSGLGATFQQQKLTDTAGEIISAFDRLVDNGADFNVVLSGMTDEINTVVQESLRFGTEIPENMRPWIEALIKSRDLVDENGVAITDIDKLKFGPAVKSDVDKLIDAIKELIAAIGTKLPTAIRDLAGVRVDPIRIPFKYELEGDDLRIPALASGGVVTRPTLALVGEVPEAIVPLNQLASVAPSGGGGTAIIELDGRVLTAVIVPSLPGEIRRYVAA